MHTHTYTIYTNTQSHIYKTSKAPAGSNKYTLKTFALRILKFKKCSLAIFFLKLLNKYE